jgi:tetratricopeptide (TPR) repeat protein
MAVAVFAIGSAPRWAACLTAALCLATVVPLVSSRRYLHRRPLVLMLVAVAMAATALQLIPLPAAVVDFISPHRWLLAVENAKAWGTDPESFLPLSYDMPQTLIELAKFAGYLAFAYTCVRLSESSHARRWMLSSAAVIGGAMALTAVAHHIAKAKKLYGLYEPEFNAPSFLAPLLNPNHQAALLAFSVPIAIGIAVATPGPRRALWGGIALICAGVAFLTESRGGVISMVVGSGMVTSLVWLQQRRGLQTGDARLPKNVIVPAIIMMSCALALLVAFTAGGVAQELSKTTTEELSGSDYKLEAWRSSKALMYRHPWTGIGRGSFEFAFTRVHPSGTKTYSHVENEYLQAIIDWGVPISIALGLLLALIVIAMSRRTMVGPLEAGAIGGLVALGLHNFIDFNLEFPAVALPALMAVAVVLPTSLRKAKRSPRRVGLRTAALAAGAIVVLLAASPLGRTSKVEAASLDSDIDEPLEKVSSSSLAERARVATARHPSDYVEFGLAARALFRKGDSRAVELLNRALDLNPECSGVHWMAAQMLASTGHYREQGLIEYVLALKTAIEPRAILADMLTRFPSVDSAVLGLPLQPELAEKISTELGVLLRDDVALAYLERLHKEIPDNYEVAGLAADFALRRGQAQLALERAKQAYDKDKGARNSTRWGRALVGVGRAEEAEAMIDVAIMNVRSRGTRQELIAMLILRGDVQRERKKYFEAKETLSSALNLASERKDVASIYRSLAKVEEASGNANSATVIRQRADSLDPGGAVLDSGPAHVWWFRGTPTTTGTASGVPPQTTSTPADGKPADGKPADGKPADGKPADGKPADGKPADGKPADGKTPAKPADGKPADGKTPATKPADGKPADGKTPAAKTPAAETPAAKTPATKTPATKPPATKPADSANR